MSIMKKRCFLCLLLLSLVSGKTFAGNDYHPMVAEGKQWLMTGETVKAHYDFVYYVSGDTVFDGNEYKKLYMKVTISQLTGEDGRMEEVSSSSPALYACLQESDGRVYMLKNGERTVLYDFNLAAGDIAFDTDRLTLSVTKVDTVSVNGIKRKRLWMKETYKTYDTGSRTGYWVEGIGSNYGLEESHGWDGIPMSVLSECYENAILLFSASDFDAPAWSGGVATSLSDRIIPPSSAAVTYDLQGRRVIGSRTKGVYIQDGKKMVR